MIYSGVLIMAGDRLKDRRMVNCSLQQLSRMKDGKSVEARFLTGSEI